MRIRNLFSYLLLFLIVFHISSELSFSDDKLRVAIMPFDNLSKATGDPQLETLTYGMSESLISGLCRIKDLILLERSQIQKILQEQALGQSGVIDNNTAPKVGNLLGANILVIGSFQVLGNQIKLVARFVDAQTGEIDKSKVVSVRGKWTDDVFDLQDELARLFIDSFNLSHTESDLSKITNIFKSTKSYTAYDYYIKGRNEHLKLNITGYENAIGYFKKALEIDNNYALALTALAEAYFYLGWDKQQRALEFKKEFENGLYYANKAITANPNLSEAYRAMASASIVLKTNEESKYAAKAIELNPNDAEAYMIMSQSFPPKDVTQQINYIKKAINLQPRKAIFYYMCGEYYQKFGSYAGYSIDSAIPYYQKAVELDGNLIKARVELGKCYHAKGDLESAKQQFDYTLKLDSDDVLFQQEIANFYAAIDSINIAIKITKKIISINYDYPNAHHLIGRLYEAQKNEKEAIREYNIAVGAYRKAIENAASNLLKIYNLDLLGNLYLSLKQPDLALNCFNEILKFQIDINTEVMTRYTMAVAYAFKNNIKKSLKELKNAIKIGDKVQILNAAKQDPNLVNVVNHPDFRKLK